MSLAVDHQDFYSEPGLARAIGIATEDEAFPQYGYGMTQAAALAGMLGHSTIAVLELGVAGGNGIVSMEAFAKELKVASGVNIKTHGFDLGSGMPVPIDYRDLPYIWQAEFFKMDEMRLRSRLDTAQLHLGKVKDTIPLFQQSNDVPIGFISFDLDYYSSTADALAALMKQGSAPFLPRVVCYFDDTVGPHHEMHSSFAGELLAIDEFNQLHPNWKLGKLNGLRYKIFPNDGPWVEGIYILHLFDHPDYNRYIYPVAERQFPLTS